MTHHQLEDHQMVMISQYHPGINTQLAQDHQGFSSGEVKPSRRRKKNKGETSNNGVVRKRKLSQEQVNLLEHSFGDAIQTRYEDQGQACFELGLDLQQVAVWFQNKRARWKNKKLEDEYSKLKSQHEITIVEKCRLETQILKMKEQLSEAKKEIQRLLLDTNCARVSSNNNSPFTTSSSIISMEQPYILEGFGMEGILMDNNVYFGC